MLHEFSPLITRDEYKDKKRQLWLSIVKVAFLIPTTRNQSEVGRYLARITHLLNSVCYRMQLDIAHLKLLLEKKEEELQREKNNAQEKEKGS